MLNKETYDHLKKDYHTLYIKSDRKTELKLDDLKLKGVIDYKIIKEKGEPVPKLNITLYVLINDFDSNKKVLIK